MSGHHRTVDIKGSVTILVGELAGRSFPIEHADTSLGNRHPIKTIRFAIKPPAGYGPGRYWWYTEHEVVREGEET